MLFILIVWAFTFLVIYSIGFSIIAIINKEKSSITKEPRIDEAFFIGFVAISIFSSFYSIIAPVDITALAIVLLCAFLLIINSAESSKEGFLLILSSFNRQNYVSKFVIFFVIGFLIISVTKFIQDYDTGLYHTQNIKWIIKYPVVPGLGNVHGRFAFNSLFFPISALFTIDTLGYNQYPPVLIYPLNGVASAVLLLKLYFEIGRMIKVAKWGDLISLSVISGLCLYYFSNSLSSPSPDIIGAVIIIYTFLIFSEANGSLSKTQLFLLSGLIFIGIAIKLSSLFLIFLLIPILFNKFTKRKLIIILGTGLLIISPFLIRNYYLSGYLIYPFPAIDIYNVDWKIPESRVLNEKNAIESWAKKPGENHSEVLNWSFSEWTAPWFLRQSNLIRVILLVNLMSIFSIIIFYLKREWSKLFLQAIVIANLIFWLLNGPDPRFVYGFLFYGVSLVLSGLLILVGNNIFRKVPMVLVSYAIILGVPLVIHSSVFQRFISMQTNWKYPERIQSTELQWWKSTNFDYSTPLKGSRCFDAPLPCSPYKNDHVILRKNSLKDGFRVKD